MNLFQDMFFFLFLAAGLIPAVILGVLEKPLKYYGMFLTLVFLLLALGRTPVGMIHLAAYAAYEVILLRVFLSVCQKREKPARRTPWLPLFLAIAPLIYDKFLAAFGEMRFARDLPLLHVLGISYLTFKSVQMLLEMHDGVIKEMNIPDTLYFLLFFPAILSGPIDRSRRFGEDIGKVPDREEYLGLLSQGLYKIALGMFYKFAMGAGFYLIMRWIIGKYVFGLAGEIVYLYAYGFQLFFDFAGYSLMAIGVSYILGIRTPENFDKPFIATDIKDFWNRWHITLSHWFRDYLFSRFMMASLRGKWFQSRLTGASVAFIINMGVMGLWHGFTWYYIAYGLYHGVLLALTEVYQKKSQFYKKHKKDKTYLLISRIITLHLVLIGFYLFSGRVTESAFMWRP